MIALRRYVLPGIGGLAAYVLLGCIFDFVPEYYIPGLLYAVLVAYYMRFCDDILDYAKDVSRGCALLSKKALILLAVVSVVGMIGISVGTSLLLLIPPAVVSAQFLMKEQFRNIIKPLFLPAVFLALFNTVFTYHHFVIALCIIAFGIDLLILVKKGKSK